MDLTIKRISQYHVAALLSCCVACGLMAAPAGAADRAATEASKTPVRLSDLDLGTRQGQEQARRRLSATATRLCNDVVDSRHVEATQAFADCVNDALAPALAELAHYAEAGSTAVAANAVRADAGR